MSGQHARCSASSAKRWMACPGSLQGTRGDDKGSHAASDGTFAHDIAAKCLASDGGIKPSDFLLKRGTVDGFDVECDEEMVEGIDLYVDAVRDDLQDGDMQWVEMPLLEALKDIDGDLGGTADHVRYREKTKSLRVTDFKYGAGVYVEAEDNTQAKIYALGALLKVGLPCDEIEVVIIQPRYEGAAPVRSWKFPVGEVFDFVVDVREACAATRLKDAPLHAGSHCQFCPRAREVVGSQVGCPEQQRMQHALVAQQFDVAAPFDADAVAKALAAIPIVKERIKAIEELAYNQAKQGTEIPGFKLVDKVPRRSWKSEEEAVAWAKANGIDPYGKPPVKSPAQLEKALAENAPKGKKKEAGKVLEPLVDKVSSGTVLVPVADNRPAVRVITVEAFEVVKEPAVLELF